MSAESDSQIAEFTLVLLSDFGQSNCGGILLVNKFAQGSFSLHEAVGDVQLFAEVGKPDNQFDGVDVVGNCDKFGFFLFNEFGDVVESELKVIGLRFRNFLFWVKIIVLSALNLASATNRALRCLASYGEYFFKSLNNTLAE